MTLKNIYTSLLFLSLCALSAKAQKLDSLLKELNKYKKEDTVKLDLLCKIANEYQYVSPAKGLAITDTAAILAKQLNNANGIARAYRLKGENYVRKSEYKTAQDWLQQSVSIYEKTVSVRRTPLERYQASRHGVTAKSEKMHAERKSSYVQSSF